MQAANIQMLVVCFALLPEAWLFTSVVWLLLKHFTDGTLSLLKNPFELCCFVCYYCLSSSGSEISLSLSFCFLPMGFPLGSQFKLIPVLFPHDAIQIFERSTHYSKSTVHWAKYPRSYNLVSEELVSKLVLVSCWVTERTHTCIFFLEYGLKSPKHPKCSPEICSLLVHI